jgi:ATP phosphoribosyltransferase
MTNNNNNDHTLKIGLPKGSLQESTFRFLARAGFTFSINSRSYFPSVDDSEIEGLLIRAQEIAKYVEEGVFDIGLTGRDWILETGADVIEIADLMYAKQSLKPISWVLAVPVDSPIRKAEDLQGKRIATELIHTTKTFLDSRKIQAHIEFSWGATEVKTPLLADAIVEATETGSSLRANNLRIVETVVTSTTRLIANKSSWQDSWKREKIENLVTLIQGAVRADGQVGLKMNIAREHIDKLMKIIPSMKNPTISALYDPGWVAVEIIAAEKMVRELIPNLKRCGACDIIEYPLNKVIP